MSTENSPSAHSHQVTYQLEQRLEELKKRTGSCHELNVEWHPNCSSTLSGKVENNIIYIFEEEPEKALDTLVHEFLDSLVSHAIKPYERLASYYRIMLNKIIEKMGEEAYQEKEHAIEALKNLIS